MPLILRINLNRQKQYKSVINTTNDIIITITNGVFDVDLYYGKR